MGYFPFWGIFGVVCLGGGLPEAEPRKISFFVWRLVHRWLPFDEIILTRGISLASRCFCCHREVESVDHLFIWGLLAMVVWDFFAHQFWILNLRGRSVSSMLVTWFSSLSTASSRHVRVVVSTSHSLVYLESKESIDSMENFCRLIG